MLNNHPRTQLCFIIQQYGQSIINEPKRCKGMLSDLAPQHRLENNLLITALEQKVAQELVKPPSLIPIAMQLDSLAKRLHNNHGTREDFAYWAVESWALALQVIGQPMSKQIVQATVKTAPPPEPEVVVPSVRLKQPYEPEMVFIKGGRFMMGSPSGRFLMGGAEEGRSSDERQHEVSVADFEIGKYLVTQAQWQAVMGSNPSHFKGDDLPVETVSWLDVQDFIEKLNAKTGQRYRLPTEAEWEYACRAGTTTPFYTGSTVSTDQANYDGNYVYGNGKKGVYKKETTPVGSYPPNPWGLYDMMGNVWEWTASTYVANYDGSESKSSSNNNAKSLRVVRGGSWDIKPYGLRSASRGWNAPGDRSGGIGLRLSRM